MSCVTTIEVTFNFLLKSIISSFIASAPIGSTPVVGSSYKIIFGSLHIALARPTRFLMPPLNSAGISSSISLSPTMASDIATFLRISLSGVSVCSLKAKLTFSYTVKESKSAAPWKSMPKVNRNLSNCLSSILPTSAPSIMT